VVIGRALLLVDGTVVVPECAVDIPECVIVIPIAGEMHVQLFHYGDVLQQRELCVVHVVVNALLSVIKKLVMIDRRWHKIPEICTFFEFNSRNPHELFCEFCGHARSQSIASGKCTILAFLYFGWRWGYCEWREYGIYRVGDYGYHYWGDSGS